MDRFAAHIDANRARYYDELCALLRRPSIAAQGLGLDETAALVAERLERLGATVQVLRMPGAAPVVYCLASWNKIQLRCVRCDCL